MKKLKKARRAGALCLACVVVVLFSAGAYLQASEKDSTAISAAENSSDSIQEDQIKVREEAAVPEGQAEAQKEAAVMDSRTEVQKESAVSEGQTEIQEETSAPETQTEIQEETAASGTQTEVQEETVALETQTEVQEETVAPGSQIEGDQSESETVGLTGQTEERVPQEAGDSEESQSEPESPGEPGEGQTEDSGQTEESSETGEEDTLKPENIGKEENTEEENTELSLEEVLEEARRQDIDFLGLAPGESLTFYTSIGQDDGNGIMPMAVTAVTVTRAATPYKYSDYGYGTFQTYKYTVTFGSITATAYCIRPTLDPPGSSTSYKVTRLKDAKTLAKVCYYGTKAAGDEGFFAEMHPKFSAGQRFIITHLAAAYANGSPDAFSGANQKAQSLAMELYEYCMANPDIPDVDMEFSKANVTAYADGETEQRTEVVKFKADSAQSIKLKLPKGVVLHNETTRKKSSPGEDVVITGGTEFYLSAPLDQATAVGASWSATMKGSVTKDYSAYKISTGETTQDLALVFGEGVDEERYIDFSVKWVKPVSIKIQKTDEGTGGGLAGAEFGVFLDEGCTYLLTKFPLTDAQGATSATLYPIQDVVYLREITPPSGYLLNDQVYSVNLLDAKQSEEPVSYTFTNKKAFVPARLKLVKEDAQTGKAQGDAVLERAVYGLYAREDISDPNTSGVAFHAGDQAAVLTTDAKGEAMADNLYTGKYYIKEISPPNGYLLDQEEHEIELEPASGDETVIEKKCVLKDTVIRQPFQLMKIAGNGEEKYPLEGAGFTAYLASTLKTGKDGSYDFSSASPVRIGKNGETELFTDKEGRAVSAPLPFGTYIVRETTVPAGYTPVDDFEVKITENNPDKPQAWRILLDKEFEAKLKIIKRDDVTQKNVLEASTEFKVYDMDAKKYVEQVTTYPKEEKHTSYFTDKDGYLVLPQALSRGHYRIEEVKAPEGYTLGGKALEVTIDVNTAYRADGVSGGVVVEAVASNHPVRGRIRIVKKGETLKEYKKDFVYGEVPLSGAVYEIYAAEDIYTADHQRDEAGNRILEYAKGTLAGKVTTGENGEGFLDNLPLGMYRVIEKTAPEGYVHSAEEKYVRLTYADQNTPLVMGSAEFINARQKVEISAIKKNALNGDLLAGAEFGLYAKADIQVNKKTIVRAGTQLASAVTGKDGKAVFEQDLPFGSYYVKELRAPEGFVLSGKTTDLSAAYEGPKTEVIRLEAVFENEPTIVEFTKSDVTTGTELDGAALSVLDKEGNIVDSWISEKEKPHIITGLKIGESYVLREELAPYGYLRAEEVEFTVADTGKVQKVNMADAVPVGRIIISKTGELVDSVTWNEMVAGTIDSIFGYISGSLREVTFDVYAAEDIRAADGVSSDYYKKDELVASITTDSLGYARLDDLPLGKYYISEKETAEGFLLDGEPREVDLTYRDQDTPVVTYDEEWQNMRQKIMVTILKKEKGTDHVLAGGVFALCAGADIVGMNGDVLVEADTVIEQKMTGEDGRLVFSADLPFGGTYYVKEIKAPAGYATTDRREEFTFSHAGNDMEQMVFDFTFENAPIQVQIFKSDIATGGEVPGARLQVRDEIGEIVDQWTSGTHPHMILGLEAGKTYTLREESAPKGYVIAEEVEFKVGDTENIQTVTMEDACTQGKVVLRKTDQDTGKPLKGVEFTLYDSKGKALETLVTDKKGRAESALYPIAVYKKGAYDKEIVYTLKETKPLAGYQMDGTVHEVRFEYQDDQTPVVKYRLDLKNEKEKESVAPRTGDNTDFLPPAAAMASSLCAVAVLTLIRKRNKRLS